MVGLRKLAAIMAVDVVGYSVLMGEDEEGTARLVRERRDAVTPLIANSGGRIFKTMGDGFLLEFASVVEAVNCAIAIQRGMATPTDTNQRQIVFRVAVHLGDVLIEGDDILGDGVNVAARLESVCEPGGVLISGAAYEIVQGRVDAAFTDMGEMRLKNISRPVRAYLASIQSTDDPLKKERSGSELSFLMPSNRFSIAVLPFTNIGGDTEQEYFCDGVIEDIITALSRVRWFFVIARSSSFAYKGKTVEIRQIGRELGVRYVLIGTMRKGGSRVRINSQLVEAESGLNLWADQFDGDISDIFQLQHDIAANVSAAVEPNILSTEIERSLKSRTVLSAYDLYLRALPDMYAYSNDGFLRAEVHLSNALVIDSRFSDAWTALSDCIARRIIAGWFDDWDEGTKQACFAASQAIASDPENGRALSLAAWNAAMLARRNDEAYELANHALRLHPNSTYVRNNCAWVYIYHGEPDLALHHLQVARRMNPVDPREYLTFNAMALAHLTAKRFSEVLRWSERAIQQRPGFPPPYRFRASALAHLGPLEEAFGTIQHMLTLQPNSTISRAARTGYKNPADLAILVEGLRLAGLPE